MTMLFAALHESLSGPTRHFVATQQFSRFRREADIASSAYRSDFITTP